MKPTTAPKKIVVNPTTQKGSSLPVVAPPKDPDLATLRKRLTNLGLTFTPKDTEALLKSKLDKALAGKMSEAAEALAQDPQDCFGKPAMRDPKDPDCKRCPDFQACGVFVDKALTTQVAKVAEAAAEAEAEEEAEAVVVPPPPSVAPKAAKATAAAASHGMSAPALKPKEVAYRTDVELLYRSKAPDKAALMNGEVVEYEEDMADFVVNLYKVKPTSMPAFMRDIMMKQLKASKSEAIPFGVAILKTLVEDNLLTIKPSAAAKVKP